MNKGDNMKTLDKINIAIMDSGFDEDSLSLKFTNEGMYTGSYPLPEKYLYDIWFKEKKDNGEILPTGVPEHVWIDGYQDVEKFLDEEDALPNDVIFKFVDGDKVLEEAISLREFLRKYIFDGNLLEEIYDDL